MNSLSPCFITQPVFLPQSAAEPDANDDVRVRTLRDLRDQLRALQQRLGTPAEHAGDFDQAREVAHEINNRLTIECLHSAMSEMAANIARPTGSHLLVA